MTKDACRICRLSCEHQSRQGDLLTRCYDVVSLNRNKGFERGIVPRVEYTVPYRVIFKASGHSGWKAGYREMGCRVVTGLKCHALNWRILPLLCLVLLSGCASVAPTEPSGSIGQVESNALGNRDSQRLLELVASFEQQTESDLAPRSRQTDLSQIAPDSDGIKTLVEPIDFQAVPEVSRQDTELEIESSYPSLWHRMVEGYALNIPAGQAGRLYKRHLSWFEKNPRHLQRVFSRAQLYLYDIVQVIEDHQLPMEIAEPDAL